jgi:very-short-patch-repair endonuclease
MASRFSPETPGLIAVLNTRADLNYALTEHWYHIPVRSAPPDVTGRRWIGFFLNQAFGARALSIPYWAAVEEVTTVRRVELLPAEAEHPRASAWYYRLALGPLEKRPEPIYCYRRRRIVFISSVWSKFVTAREINDLYHESPLEDRLWTAFQNEGVAAERQWFTGKGRHRYCLDFALFCPQRNIDVECDGDAWHANPEKARQDNERNNSLEQNGWHVLRFSTAQLTQELPACVRHVQTTVQRCGGLYLPDGTVWPLGKARAVLLPPIVRSAEPKPVVEPAPRVNLGRLLTLTRQQERKEVLADLEVDCGTAAVAQALRQALADFSPRVRGRAVWCLGELGELSELDPHPLIEEALVACLAKEINRTVRRRAYAACAKVGSGELEDAILARLEKEENRVLQAALKALARCGSSRASAPIRRVLEREQPEYIIRAAQAALRQCQRWW